MEVYQDSLKNYEYIQNQGKDLLEKAKLLLIGFLQIFIYILSIIFRK